MSAFTARVITVSTRAAAGVWEDTSGPIIVTALSELGFDCAAPVVIADGPDIETQLRSEEHTSELQSH